MDPSYKERSYIQQTPSVPFHSMEMLGDEEVERGDGESEMKGKAQLAWSRTE
jgi:hypothetical protein